MLKRGEIEALVADLESDRVERKESLVDKEKLQQAICAFANDLPGHRAPGYLFIAEAMKALGYVERFGTGIARARTSLKANGNPPPEFVFEPTHVQVTLRSASF